MRRAIRVATIMLAAMPVAVAAQQRTADDYVCLLTGSCGEATPPPENATGRFALAKPPVAPVAPVDLRLTFASGSATLTPAAKAEARTLADALARPALAGRRLRIEGHTDSLGSRAANLALSQRRADAVMTYLIARGVARARLQAFGHGFDRPLPGHAGSDPANRRVVAALVR